MSFSDLITKKLNKRKLKLLRKIAPPPISCRHAEYSILASLDDEKSIMTERLFSVALDAVRDARNIDLSDISERMPEPPFYPDVWPGEHYKLLAALVRVLKPKLVVEVGTALGHSALALKKYLEPGARLVTFDIFEWSSLNGTILKESDFESGNMTQVIGDLANDSEFEKNKDLLSQADFIFIDGPKDIIFEKALLKKMEGLHFSNQPIIMFDDIRLWNMLEIWRNIKQPKMDLTSFGHWSGTGLIDWNN